MVLLNNDTFLIDREFLRLLDLEREKEIFAKIVLLDFQENVVEEIEGRVTQGSVTVDGTSSVRRTCSVTLVANEMNIHEYYWGLHSKFKLYVGLKNVVKERQPYKEKYKDYPDICWFKMGTYLISNFNTSQSTSQYTITLQGKDKMALLNGEVGGVITPLSWDFGTIDEISADGTITHKDYLIKDIILEAVHEHAKEPYWNIIINDLEDCGLELLEYRGDVPLYLVYSLDTNVVEQTAFELPEELVGDLTDEEIMFDDRINLFDEDIDLQNTSVFYHPDDADLPEEERRRYTIIKAEYGDVIGYRTTDLTYAGDLISNVGETVTSMLDKIKAMLGEFEYFYDLDGRFVFQRKPAYIRNLFSPAGQAGANDDSQSAAETSATTYSFDNSLLVTSFANAPNLANLKNDFSIWGVRKGVSGIEIPIHLRYAIDTKPWYYVNYSGETFITQDGIDQYKQQLSYSKILQREIAERAGKTIFTKRAVPSFLKNKDGSSDWWDITNWADYYQILTGEYPTEQLDHYGTEGFIGTLTFPDGSTHTTSTRGQLIIDLDSRDFNPFYGNGPEVDSSGHKTGVNAVYDRSSIDYREYTSTTWSPFQHGFNGCSHTYSEFIYLDNHNYCKSFIYKPTIPETRMTEQFYVDMSNIYIEMEDIDLSFATVVDWRELIYQMSLDKNKHQHDSDFYVTVDKNNTLPDGTHIYPNGYTGYEQYYVDINGFWRDLYDPNYQYTYDVTNVRAVDYAKRINELYIYQSCEGMSYQEAMAAITAWKDICGDQLYKFNYRNQLVPASSGIEEEYFNEHADEYAYVRGCKGLVTEVTELTPAYLKPLVYDTGIIYHTQSAEDFYKPKKDEDGNLIISTLNYWSIDAIYNPEGLNFWFDFYDAEGDLGKYKVSKVGDRTKAANDTNIKSIYFREIPTVIFVDTDSSIAEEKSKKGTGYTYIQLPTYLENLFSMSSQGKSAMDLLDEWVYSFACCTEAITINALPVYYLEPNTRIFVRDDNSGINGEYIVTRLTFPLTHNGTMSISATKAVENLY